MNKATDRTPPTEGSSRNRELKRPKAPEVEGNPPKAGNKNLARYAQLTSMDKVAYHQSKLAYAQAYAQYDAAKRAALQTFFKPFDNFVAALKVYDDADDAIEAAIRLAQTQLDNIGSLSGKLKPRLLVEPDGAKSQLDQLSAAVDEYKKAADAVAAAVAAKTKAEAALAPLAQPGNLDRPNQDAQDLAEDQYSLELAQAQVALETAYDTYMVKNAEIVGHLAYSAEAA